MNDTEYLPTPPLPDIEALRRSNARLEEFAHIASHDLRAPLRAITSLIEWIGEDLVAEFGPLPEQIGNDLTEVAAQSVRMTKMVDDLLDYSQIGQAQQAPRVFDPRDTVLECLKLLVVPDGFTVTVAEELPQVCCTPIEFSLCLRNIVSNSIKHHDRPTGRIQIDGWDKDGFGWFRVRDNGPGVDQKFADQIFEMFRTLDSSRGSGIGLGMVRKTVQHYGGHAQFEPNPKGRGSDFLFSFPQTPRGITEVCPVVVRAAL